jgi:hypothetical protein
VCDDFAVAAGPEGVGGELRPELFMVVDLPIHLQGKASFLFSTKEKVTNRQTQDIYRRL